MTRHVLAGIRPEPLAAYLAGLGVIRALGEQADRHLTAWWDETQGLIVETTVDDLAGWFTQTFEPTPVLRAWNQGSGFGADEEALSPELRELLAIGSPRLDSYRATLRAAHDAARLSRDGSWENKDVVREFRNRCPQAALAWIDAAALHSGDGLWFPPLLGDGGHDGRFDFSTNLHRHLRKVLGTSDERTTQLLRDVLQGTQVERWEAAMPVGQFDPGAAGGANSSPFGAADSIVNPWGYVLMIEGALMFAAKASRRTLHEAGRAAVPFTVRASPEGSASGAPEKSYGEVWAPLWRARLSYVEIRHLFGEARATWRGRPARRAIDFYAATRTLGVARGISAFTRYGIHQRYGRMRFAVPVDRVVVTNKPAVELAATPGIDDWVQRVHRANTSAAIIQAIRQYERAQLAFIRDGEPLSLGRLLATVTDLEITVGRSGRARANVSPYEPPSAERFLALFARAESPELRIAVGLASCRTRRGAAPARTMRQILLPINPGPPHQLWRETPIVTGMDVRPLRTVLAEVLVWRARTSVVDETGEDHRQVRGVTTFRSGLAVPAADLHALARPGALDEPLLMMWFKACLALDWRGVTHAWGETAATLAPLPTLAILHAFAAGAARNDATDDGVAVGLEPDWPTRLAAGRVRHVHDEAARRLRQLGLAVAPGSVTLDGLSGVDIAAALVARCAKPRRLLLSYVAAPLRPNDDTYADARGSEEEDS